MVVYCDNEVIARTGWKSEATDLRRMGDSRDQQRTSGVIHQILGCYIGDLARRRWRAQGVNQAISSSRDLKEGRVFPSTLTLLVKAKKIVDRRQKCSLRLPGPCREAAGDSR